MPMQKTSWDGVSDAYRRSFGTVCAGSVNRLVSDADGQDHLDVGCGTGELVDAGLSVLTTQDPTWTWRISPEDL
jgi:hypothetical protein